MNTNPIIVSRPPAPAGTPRWTWCDKCQTFVRDEAVAA